MNFLKLFVKFYYFFYQGPLKTCSTCGDSYHHTCHRPLITKEQSDDWDCVHCSTIPVKIKTNQPIQSQSKISHQVSATHRKINTKDNSEASSIAEVKKILQEISKIETKIPKSFTPPPSVSGASSQESLSKSIVNNKISLDADAKDEVQEFVGFSDAEAIKRSSRESSASMDANSQYPFKRGRGRPRKYPRESSADRTLILTQSSAGDKDLTVFKSKESEIFSMEKKFEVPDASKWSCETVYKYFYKYFPDNAAVFLKQVYISKKY